MKKLFVVAAAFFLLSACNNSGEQKQAATDTLKNAESPLLDAINTRDSVTKKIGDSIDSITDSTGKK